MTHLTHTSRWLRSLVGLLAISLVAACGGNDDDTQPSATDSSEQTTTATESTTPTAPSTSTPAGLSPSTSASSTSASSASAPPATTTPAIDDATAGQIEQMLAASLTDLPWNCCGADGPATGAAVAIRTPGANDVLLAAGSDLDGSPFDPTAPFLASSLAISLVQSVAFQLVDSGVLEPTATVDAWAPQMPGASEVTVQMLLDGTTGWGDFGAAVEANVVADLSRVWTLAEVVDAAAGIVPTGSAGAGIETTVLGHIMEQVTGSPLAELLTRYVTEPLDLEATTVDMAAPKQPGYQHGVFVLGGALLDTASVPTDAYFSFLGAAGAATSTLPDLLDLLDAWVTGDLLGAERAATPDKFQPANASPDASTTIIGSGIPVNGYCDHRDGDQLEYPCTPAGDGLDVMAIGRMPNGVGTTLYLWYFPATGVSIAMHHNSQEWVTRDTLSDFAIEIHDLVAVTE